LRTQVQLIVFLLLANVHPSKPLMPG
jgi:hypothetical protein